MVTVQAKANVAASHFITPQLSDTPDTSSRFPIPILTSFGEELIGRFLPLMFTSGSPPVSKVRTSYHFKTNTRKESNGHGLATELALFLLDKSCF